MPTGYTAPIYEGEEMSGKEFILRCARAFGATVMMRDEPLNKEIHEFEPSNHHIKEVEKAKKELSKYLNMSKDDIQKVIDEDYRRGMKHHVKYMKDKKELLNRYTQVLNEVEAWNPPSDDHSELKNYAIKQLKESIEFDCDTSYITEPQKQFVDEWLQTKIERCNRDIQYHTKEHQEEIERVESRNKWVRLLKESL